MTRAPCLQSQQPTFDRSQDRYEWQLLHTKSSKSPKSTHELEYSRDSLRTIKSLFGELTSHERLLFTKWKWRKYHTVHIADVQEKLILFCQCHWRKYETVPFLWLGVFYDNNQLIFRKLRTPKSLRKVCRERTDLTPVLHLMSTSELFSDGFCIRGRTMAGTAISNLQWSSVSSMNSYKPTSNP